MADERISQFEDQPLIADCVYEYTEALRANSVPIVIDNGNKAIDVLSAECNKLLNIFAQSNPKPYPNPNGSPRFMPHTA